MTPEAVLEVFRRTGVLREGHFLLTSGRHSPIFLLCAQALQYPAEAERLCRAMAEPYRDAGVDVVIGPAMGGVILAYETARALGARALFAEKAEGGRMEFRRGFVVRPGERVLSVEDAVTTGGSLRGAVAAARAAGGDVVGAACLVDRSAGRAGVGAPLTSLVRLDIPSWDPDACPLCRDGTPLELPKAVSPRPSAP